jgi:hypothetical protein
MCVCNQGSHQINGKCSKCPQNTLFDGHYCSPINSYNSITCDSNQILVNGQCVCRAGWNKIHGKCYQCP